jgi:hypothetical protein
MAEVTHAGIADTSCETEKKVALILANVSRHFEKRQ